MLRDLVLKNRSYRRFKASLPLEIETLRELVDLGRLSASGGNVQPLKYSLSVDPEKNEKIFPHTVWAGYLTEWPGPAEGEKPTGYIIILGDTEVSSKFGCDHGIAAQSILLGAAEKGIGGCMIGSIDRPGLAKDLKISPRFEILLILALGYPSETVVLEECQTSKNIEYWRDEQDIHHVPKRPLDEVIIKL